MFYIKVVSGKCLNNLVSNYTFNVRKTCFHDCIAHSRTTNYLKFIRRGMEEKEAAALNANSWKEIIN